MLRIYNKISLATTARYLLKLLRVATILSVLLAGARLQATSVEHYRTKEDIVKQLTSQVADSGQRKCSLRDQPES
jgi:hypothetical protein